MPKILDIKAYQVNDSKNDPTIQTTVFLENNVTGTFIAPSGSSVGLNEAVDLKNEVAGKKSVSLAVSNLLNIILPHLRGADAFAQDKIDSLLLSLDKTPNKSTLGGNTLISVSAAVAVAAANYKRIPVYLHLNQLFQKYHPSKMAIPQPMFLMIEGGAHGLFNLDFQEFLLSAPAFAKVFEAQIAAKQVFYYLEETLDQLKIEKRYGMEGGLTPLLPTNRQALELIVRAIKKTSFKVGDDVKLSLDCAASQIRREDGYHIRDFTKPGDSLDMVRYYAELCHAFSLYSLEDPFDQSDLEGWQTYAISQPSALLVGDDLTCTNPGLITKAINLGIIKSVIIKPNQIGTLSETFQAVALAKNNGLEIIASHRSGESFDTFISDFAVGVGANYLKAGGFAQKVRQVKYERLIQIENEISHK